MIFDDEEFRDGFCQEFLGYGLAIVRERKIDVERQRVRPASQQPKDRLGFMELVIHQPSDGGADAGELQVEAEVGTRNRGQGTSQGIQLGKSGEIDARGVPGGCRKKRGGR